MAVVHHVAALLRAMRELGGSGGVLELAARTGLARSTASRTLQQMNHVGLAEKNPHNGKYRPGLLVFEIGQGYRRGETLIDAACQTLAALAERWGYSSALAVLDGRHVVTLRCNPGRLMPLPLPPAGSRAPAVATSSGRALLAGFDDTTVRTLLTPYPDPGNRRSPQNLDALLTRLTQIRAQGYAEESDENQPGLGTIAVAIGYGREAISLYAAYPTPRLGQHERRRLRANLLAAAQQLEHRFSTHALGV